MAVKNTVVFDRPELFIPSVQREIRDGGQGTVASFSEVTDTNIESTASFRYDPPGVGLKSTQQVNVDFTRFENHTFFNSAEVNVNVAFDRMINEFPFDGTKQELEKFFDRLTGFEKYVYDRFPKNVGYLFFSGGLDTHISVKDFAGSDAASLSTDTSGRSVLDPGNNPFTIEMQLFVPNEENGDQVVCQKVSGTNDGVTLSLLSSSNLSSSQLLFTFGSGSVFLNTSASLQKGEFNHIAATFDRRPGRNALELFVNEELKGRSQFEREFGLVDFKTSPLLIGSGTQFFTSSAESITPTQALSGAIDEFRLFHSVRSLDDQKEFAQKSIFPTDDLALYFKFNEPTGTFGETAADELNRIVLDSSGNSLHAFIDEDGFSFDLRSTGSVGVPMVHERLDLSPVLFPHATGVLALNADLLASASSYDDVNPNLITRLVPPHYFQEGQQFEGFESEDGTIGSDFEGDLGTAQLLSMMLFVYAKFFDELKIFTDTFARMNTIGYDAIDTVPDQFLIKLAQRFDFKLPGFFSDATLSQFIEPENLTTDIATAANPLRHVQNQMLRRILASMRDIISSKGTIHGIKAFFRSVGIDPDNSLRIREFGGPTRATLGGLRERKTETSTLLNMSASAASLTSPFLSGSRLEVGFPDAQGSFVATASSPLHGISTEPDDGLFTSGSWTYESVYKFALGSEITNATQSLARLCVTGSGTSPSSAGIIAALVATSGSDVDDNRIRFYARPGISSSIDESPQLTLELSGANVFDGNKWHIAFGRFRNDEIGSNVSSSYFLRAEMWEHGIEHIVAKTSSFFQGSHDPDANVLSNIDSVNNASGTFIAVGSQSFGDGNTASGHRFLNDASLTDAEARVTNFVGKIGQMRFWSKALSERELTEHARNFRSLGVDDPVTNFNFVDDLSGSFGRLRIDASTDQPEDDRTAAADGTIRIFDFSQNDLHVQGTGFEPISAAIEPENFMIDQLATVIDEASTVEKIRVRSFERFSNVKDHPGSQIAPVYQLPLSQQPQDDLRLSIDFSLVDALNRDIATIFSALDEFDDALGKPELMFSGDYPRLADISDVYFNRLSEKLNVRSFQEFFKWIDTSMGSMVQQLIPHRTRFQGMNFVIENHMLERPRFQYRNFDIYLGEDRRLDRSTILLRQLVGTIKRF